MTCAFEKRLLSLNDDDQLMKVNQTRELLTERVEREFYSFKDVVEMHQKMLKQKVDKQNIFFPFKKLSFNFILFSNFTENCNKNLSFRTNFCRGRKRSKASRLDTQKRQKYFTFYFGKIFFFFCFSFWISNCVKCN